MKKDRINPFPWHWADDQGILVEDMNRILFVSGQTAMSDEGEPMHPNDIRAPRQIWTYPISIELNGNS